MRRVPRTVYPKIFAAQKEGRGGGLKKRVERPYATLTTYFPHDPFVGVKSRESDAMFIALNKRREDQVRT